MQKGKRIKLQLECESCRNRNYVTSRNPDNTKKKLNLKKFCKFCRKVTLHNEVKI